jgi:glycolate oxidase iron-sulfur subunit
LKEYGEILNKDTAYAARAAEFTAKMKDINEFLASIELNTAMGPVNAVITYQDSCHLAHGQKIKVAPRKLLKFVPGLKLQEMPMSDLCCGSAGVYNVVQNEMAMRILERKMASIDTTKASIIVTANPGCMIQLMAGSRLYGQGQEVAHVVQILDRAYSAYGERN